MEAMPHSIIGTKSAIAAWRVQDPAKQGSQSACTEQQVQRPVAHPVLTQLSSILGEMRSWRVAEELSGSVPAGGALQGQVQCSERW